MDTFVSTTLASIITDASSILTVQNETYWILISGFIVAVFLAFGVGANDVANTFGTSVGAKVISLRNACIIATIFEMAGSCLIDNRKFGYRTRFKMLTAVATGIIIAGFIVSFLLAFGIGANDVANSMGTSVGSGVLKLRTACYLATVMEIGGSVLLGYKVSDTIRKGIINPEVYNGAPQEFMLGNLAALGASAIWLILATFLKMPISGTHSIVGSVLGFTLVARGTAGISWFKMGSIVGSWFISPVLSGIVSGGIFWGINKLILQKEDAITPGLRSLPIFYGVTIFINIVSIFLDGPDLLKIPVAGLPEWTAHVFGLLISSVIAILVAVIVAIWIVPKMRRQIAGEEYNSLGSHKWDGQLVAFHSRRCSIGPGTPPVIHLDLLKDQAPLNRSSSEEKKMPPAYTQLIPELRANPEKIESLTITDEKINCEIRTVSPSPSPSSLDVLPMDGITPNSSGVPLIKPRDIETIYKSSNFMTSKDSSPTRSNSDEEGIMFTGRAQHEKITDRPGVGHLFSFLQILTAAFGSFAHGGNDVSNAIGPLIALWLVYQEGTVHTQAQTPIWLLVYGGIGISLGLWVWGRRVIKTMGEDLTQITPSSGFTIEIGAALTVLVASKLGIPVSTTHCKVGSVVSVGFLRSRAGGVDWSLFRNIIFAWVVTVPVSGGLSALLMWILSSTCL